MSDATIVAPMREKNLTRSEEIEYAKAKGVPIAQTTEKIWSIDENLWGRSIEGGRLEEPDFTPPEEIFQAPKLDRTREFVQLHLAGPRATQILDFVVHGALALQALQQRRRRFRLPQHLDGGARCGQRVARKIDPVEVLVVLGAVLQVIVDLQART